jgi:integrase
VAGSIRKQGKESWEVTVNLGRDPETKRLRRHFFTVRGKKADAERALTAALGQRDQGIDLAPAKITVAEYIRVWLRDYAEHNVAASTLQRYRGIVESHIIPTLGSRRLADLRPIDIQAAYTKWLSPGGRCGSEMRGLSPRTVLHHHRLLREAFHQAVRWQLLARNPCDAVEPPRPPRAEVQVLDEQGVRRMLDAARSEPLYALFHTAITTGARLGELLALRWQDVDFERGRVSIARTVRRYSDKGYVFSQPKTHRSRRPIALDADTKLVLLEHRRHQIEQRLLVGPPYNDQDLVFATATGTVLGDSRVRTTFGRILRAAGLKRIRLHDLRHTAATLMLKAGVNPKVVSDRLGHSTISITLDIYSHVLPDMQRDGAEALARMIR